MRVDIEFVLECMLNLISTTEGSERVRYQGKHEKDKNRIFTAR